jgi:pimeloyl-ACP methyl ester carboxylesterase
MAGSELSYLGQKHSPQLGGLVYLDAIADPMDFPWSNAEYRELTMKSIQRDKEAGKPGGPPPRPTSEDRASVDAYIAYQQRTMGWSFPAAEIRDLYEINPKDGTVGAYAVPQRVGRAIDAGSIGKDYRGITTQVLALVNVQKPPAADAHPDSRRLYELEMGFIRRWESNLKRAVPAAEIEEWPGADHYLFIRQQDRVIEALRKFLASGSA